MTNESQSCMFSRLVRDADAFQAVVDEATDIAVDHPHFAKFQGSVGVLYAMRFREYGDVDDLGQAIVFKTVALNITPEGHPDRADFHQTLAESYRDAYDTLGDVRTLNFAITHGVAAIEIMKSTNHDELAMCHDTLANAYMKRSTLLHDLDDYNLALSHKKTAIAITPADHPSMPRLQQELFSSSTQYTSMEVLSNPGTAMQYDNQTISGTPDGSTDLASLCQSLCTTHLDQSKRLEDWKDLPVALESNTPTEATSNGSEDSPLPLHILAESHQMSCNRLAHLEELETALAVDRTPTGSPDMLYLQEKLATTYGVQHGPYKLDSLQSSNGHLEPAMMGAPRNQIQYAGLNIGLAVLACAQCGGLVEDGVGQESNTAGAAAGSIQIGYSKLLWFKNNLATIYSLLPWRQGIFADLKATLHPSLKAVGETPPTQLLPICYKVITSTDAIYCSTRGSRSWLILGFLSNSIRRYLED